MSDHFWLTDAKMARIKPDFPKSHDTPPAGAASPGREPSAKSLKLWQGANVLMFGPPGGGKSHLAAAIGLALIENGWRVLFTRGVS